MKLRSPAAPLLLPLVTLGIYSLVWWAKTKNEMNLTNSAPIPTAWLLIVPIGNIYFIWKYAVGVEEFTGKTMGRQPAFWLLFLLSGIGAAIVQNTFNKTVASAPVVVAPAEAQPVEAQPVSV